MTTHSKLSPSKRHRWAKCPGSIREEAHLPPEEPGSYAIDGTRSHTLLELCIKEGLLDPLSTVGQSLTDDHGEFVIDEPRALRVKVAIDYIKQRVINSGGMVTVVAERQVNPKSLVGRDDLSGTLDCQIDGGNWLEIIDYKDGFTPVEAEGNLQLEQYAIGALAESSKSVEDGVTRHPRWTDFHMTIIQPRASKPISTWTVSSYHLSDQVYTLKQEANATDHPEAPLVPGDSQCNYCPVKKNGCQALSDVATRGIGVTLNTIDMAHQIAEKSPNTMSNDQLSKIVEAAPLMRQLLESAESEIIRRLESGQTIPGFKLVNGRGSRVWNLTEEETGEKLRKMGVPKAALYVSKFISVSQAEKLIWTKKDGTKAQLTKRQLEIIENEYVTKLAGKLTLAPESDNRQAIVNDASHLFKQIESKPLTTPVIQELNIASLFPVIESLTKPNETVNPVIEVIPEPEQLPAWLL